MTHKLHIAADFALPLDAVTQTFAVLAKRGVGKTHTGTVMAEEMLKAGQPIVVYDPTSAWWGLKSSKNGKHPGFPVVIFGGDHADVPLEESAGTTIATVIVEKRIPAILDVGLLRKNARIRFMTDFCETLYHKNREALHFFVDEAQTIAPQNIRAIPEAARLLGAMEDIVLQGRRRGLGLTIISPRPAVVNTNLRSACEVIIAMQIIAPHDRKAIEEWVDLHGDDASRAKEMLESLSSLRRGEGWVWSPSWLRKFARVSFRDRETFDSSATPEVGGRLVTPKSVAAIDLTQLGEQIKATVEKAKADDPKELHKRIAELERQLKSRPVETKTVEVEKRVEVPVLKNGQLGRTEKAITRWETAGEKALAEAAELRRLIQPAFAAPARKPSEQNIRQNIRPTPLPSPPRRKPMPHRDLQDLSAIATTPGSEGITTRQQRFLDAAASLTALQTEVTRETVAAWVGVHPRGGSVGEELKALSDAGLIVMDRGRIAVTEAGLAAAHGVDPTEAIERAKSGLSNRQRQFFEMILAVYPEEISREQIAEQAQLHPRGGSLGEDLTRLVGRGLVEGGRGRYRARSFLFAGASP